MCRHQGMWHVYRRSCKRATRSLRPGRGGLEEGDWLRAIDQVNAIILKIAQRCPATMGKWLQTGYVRKSIARKVAIGLMARGKAWMDWDKTTVADLSRLFPDSGLHLEDFPAQWSAAQLSVFLFDRDDLAVFASCYACLWHDVKKNYDE